MNILDEIRWSTLHEEIGEFFFTAAQFDSLQYPEFGERVATALFGLFGKLGGNPDNLPAASWERLGLPSYYRPNFPGVTVDEIKQTDPALWDYILSSARRLETELDYYPDELAEAISDAMLAWFSEDLNDADTVARARVRYALKSAFEQAFGEPLNLEVIYYEVA